MVFSRSSHDAGLRVPALELCEAATELHSSSCHPSSSSAGSSIIGTRQMIKNDCSKNLTGIPVAEDARCRRKSGDPWPTSHGRSRRFGSLFFLACQLVSTSVF